MAKELWFIGDDLVALSTPLRPPIHFAINTAFFCGLCGQVWARRMLTETNLPPVWDVEKWTECPNCPSQKRRGKLKMITYEESDLNNFDPIPTAILAYEFLWLYLAEQAQ